MIDEIRGLLMDVDADGKQVLVGSLSRVTGKSMEMDDLLPDWLENGVESSLRDSEFDVPVVVSAALPAVVLTETAGPEGGKGGDLDSFYEELSEEDDDESESEDEDESGDDDDVIHE
jgi:AP-3 complex subunit beta